jgi:hypothetical protein
MKFTEVWANTLYANSILKISTAVLGLVVLILTFALIRLGLRDPIIVERACFSSVIGSVKIPHTQAEIESLAKLALEHRFNSDAVDNASFISTSELLNRNKEQEELKSKTITQKILINGLKVEGTKVVVDADRLLASGKIKSVVSFPLQVELIENNRTPSNPYGLLLAKVNQIKETK